jgi:hypothetical protein
MNRLLALLTCKSSNDGSKSLHIFLNDYINAMGKFFARLQRAE